MPPPSRRRAPAPRRPTVAGHQVADALGPSDGKLDDDTFHDAWQYAGPRGEYLIRVSGKRSDVLGYYRLSVLRLR